MKDTTSNALSIKEIMNILLTQEELTATDAASNSQYGVDEDTLEALSQGFEKLDPYGLRDTLDVVQVDLQAVSGVTFNLIKKVQYKPLHFF